MKRIAFHLRIREGKRADYRRAHEEVPEANRQAYLDADLEVETFSVFERNGHVFGYMETDDPEGVKELLESDDALQAWAEEMEPIHEEAEDGRWMDELYRMF